MGALTEEAVAGGTRKVDQLLAHYAESHRNPRNEVIHLVAIPLIMLSLVGLLCALHPWIALFSSRRAWSISPGCRWFSCSPWPCCPPSPCC